MNVEKIDWDIHPDEEYQYFLFERDNGMMFFKSIQDRQDMFDSLKDCYLDDVWDEEVENIVAGEVTHATTPTDLKKKPDNLNEDGEDEEGFCWPSQWDYMCDYALTALSSLEKPEVRPSVYKYALEMERVLKYNDHKGGWEDCDLRYLESRLDDEVFEYKTESKKRHHAKASREVIDVANYCMMIYEFHRPA